MLEVQVEQGNIVAKIEIYTKTFCPYCVRAKHFLNGKGADFEEYEITMDGPKRAEMLQRSGGRTSVPQIFIDGRHIGGSDDLFALESRGELDTMLGA